MRPTERLAGVWRDEANRMEQHGDTRGATVFRFHADELVEAIYQGRAELLTLTEAATESGYSEDHIRHLVSEGRIPNAGRKGAPRVRRGDLPLKPGLSSDGKEAATAITRTLEGVA